MSHWQGWRKTSYEDVENKPQRVVSYFDPESDNIGKTDEQLLRIYFFRKPETRKNYEEPQHNPIAKRQLQLIMNNSTIRNQNQDDEEEENDIEMRQHQNTGSSQIKDEQKGNANFHSSSGSQISHYSNFSQKNKFE